MIPVSPTTRTTLVANAHHQFYGRFCTARAAMRQMMNGNARGVDASGMDISWTGADITNLNGRPSEYSWVEKSVQLWPDQPCLRSAPNRVTGEEVQWPVPTIIICSHHFGYPAKRGENVSLRKLYAIQKGICQYCYDKIPFSEATKDHIYPKDLGGSNHDFNLALACRKCNSKKSNIYPYFDKDGNVPSGVNVNTYLRELYEGVEIRPEMYPYLFQK